MPVELLASALIVAALGAVVLRRIFPWRAAVAVAGVKFAIPLIYFAAYYDATWTIIDDITYFRQGRVLLASGYNPVSVLLDGEGFKLLLYVSDGFHFLYGWFNLLTEFLLAEAYWAPVLGNVLLTCVAGVLLRRLAVQVGASARYADGLALFFLLHWELLAWSSFLNVKDLLVMMLTLWLILSVARASSPDRTRTSWLGAGIAGFLLFWIRFYVPILIGLAYLAYAARNPVRHPRRVIIGVVVSLAFFLAARERLAALAGLVNLQAGDLAFGWLRTLISPQPWSLQRDYGFLLVPSTINVALLPMLGVGLYVMWRQFKDLRFALLYAAILLASVAAYPELQGPRHRIQILFLLAWAQFHGLYLAASVLARLRRDPLLPRDA